MLGLKSRILLSLKKFSSFSQWMWMKHGFFVKVVKGFLGYNKVKNNFEFVETLVKMYLKMGCRMSLKLHTLNVLLDVFKQNLGAYSQKRGDRFSQITQQFECRYQGNVQRTHEGGPHWRSTVISLASKFYSQFQIQTRNFGWIIFSLRGH